MDNQIRMDQLKVTPQMEKEISNASPDEIKDIIHQALVDQGLAVRDSFNPSILLTATPRPEPKKFAIAITDPATGKKEFLEADSQEALNALQLQWYREHPPTTTQQDNTPRGKDGRFQKQTPADPDAVHQQRVFDVTQLELKFKRGEINAADYIQQSGALAQALEAELGMPLDEVKEHFQERQGQKEVKSWSEATEKFLNSAEGANWPGTEANKTTLGQIIQTFQTEDGTLLADLQDKQEAITIAWNYMQEHPELIKENPELVQRDKISKATSRLEIDEILGRNTRLQSQQIWGSR